MTTVWERMLLVWLLAAVVPGMLGREAAVHPPRATAATPGHLSLTVQEGLFSLQAQDASLKRLFDEVGRQLAIEVVARIPPEERITLAFERLSFTEALSRLRPYVNTLVVEDAKAPGTIRQLLVISKRLVGVPGRSTTPEGIVSTEPVQTGAPTRTDPTRPPAFRFEFDPGAVGAHGR
jgi:hypothetical protein